MSENKLSKGTLYLVSTPIGNDDDITLRALKVLKMADIVVCEEAKIGARLLHKINISKDIEILNEQNELEKAPEVIALLSQGTSVALISDCGSPVFADPGAELVREALDASINIVVIPGATSIMTALVRSGFDISSFVFAGFLSRTKEERKRELEKLATERRTVVMFETPYRLMPLLETALKIMPKRKAYIACNLTLPFETHHYGTFAELYEKFETLKFKGEFVIVFEKAYGDSSSERTGDFKFKPDAFERFSSGHKYEHKKFDRRDSRDGEHKRFDRRDSRDGEHKRFDRRDSRDGEHKRFDRRDSRDGEHKRFDRRDSRDGEHKRFDRRDSRDGEHKRFDRRDSRDGEHKRFDKRDGDHNSTYKKDRFSKDDGFRERRKSYSDSDSFDRKKYSDDNGGNKYSKDKFGGDRSKSRSGKPFVRKTSDRSSRNNFKKD